MPFQFEWNTAKAAVNAAKQAGLENTAHIAGGMDAWKKAGGPVLTG